ncbi:hypothetical protein KBC80_02390 [Candidatus Woesebacteria bacterium]|nr:hypothetical protein [Candidatus Woesebacteria bacterium]
MKRTATFFITLLLLLVGFLWTPQVVRAEDTIFTTTRLSEWQTKAVIILNEFGFDVAGLIKPSFESEKENAIVDYEPFKIYMDAYTQWNMPGQYLQDNRIIFWQGPIKRYSLYGIILKAWSEHGENNTSPECYISVGPQVSEPIPNLPELTTSGELIGSMRGLLPKETNDAGVIDTTKPTNLGIGGMNAGEDCKKQTSGVEWKPFANPQQRLSSFAGGSSVLAHMLETIMVIVERIVRLAGGGTQVELHEEPLKEVTNRMGILTKKTKQWYQQILCQFGSTPCPSNQVGDYSKNLDVTGGWPAGFIGANEQKKVNPHLELEDQIEVVNLRAGKMREPEAVANQLLTGLAEASCTVVPAGKLQAEAVMGKAGAKNAIKIKPWCRDEIEETGKCPIDLIEKGLAKSSMSCNLKNPGAYASSNTYLTSLEKQALPNGVSPLMQKVLEAAGATYNVPASVLLGTMLEEGSFNHADVWSWTDENVRLFSDCTTMDPMPSCREFGDATSEGATGPFGFIANWWQNYIESDGPYKAYLTDPSWKDALATAKPNYSECNFVDAAFTAARELGEDASHYQPDYVPPAPQTCTIDGATYNTNISFIPASCSSWTADTVALARMQYGDRTCSADVGRMIRTYKGI